jgi:hypothetical protein
MVPTTATAFQTASLSQDGAQSHADPSVDFSQCTGFGVSKIAEPPGAWLDSLETMEIVLDMKFLLRFTIFLAVALSLNSCGIANVLGRTVGRVFESAGDLTDQAMTTGL